MNLLTSWFGFFINMASNITNMYICNGLETGVQSQVKSYQRLKNGTGCLLA